MNIRPHIFRILQTLDGVLITRLKISCESVRELFSCPFSFLSLLQGLFKDDIFILGFMLEMLNPQIILFFVNPQNKLKEPELNSALCYCTLHYGHAGIWIIYDKRLP